MEQDYAFLAAKGLAAISPLGLAAKPPVEIKRTWGSKIASDAKAEDGLGEVGNNGRERLSSLGHLLIPRRGE